jgi:hypothetical protein
MNCFSSRPLQLTFLKSEVSGRSIGTKLRQQLRRPQNSRRYARTPLSSCVVHVSRESLRRGRAAPAVDGNRLWRKRLSWLCCGVPQSCLAEAVAIRPVLFQQCVLIERHKTRRGTLVMGWAKIGWGKISGIFGLKTLTLAFFLTPATLAVPPLATPAAAQLGIFIPGIQFYGGGRRYGRGSGRYYRGSGRRHRGRGGGGGSAASAPTPGKGVRGTSD